MSKKIVLITGADEPKRLAKRSAMYADSPESTRLIKTPRDLQACLSAGHTALVTTAPKILAIRTERMHEAYPGVPVEVIDTDEEANPR